jgi:hypothetical protein
VRSRQPGPPARSSARHGAGAARRRDLRAMAARVRSTASGPQPRLASDERHARPHRRGDRSRLPPWPPARRAARRSPALVGALHAVAATSIAEDRNDRP